MASRVSQKPSSRNSFRSHAVAGLGVRVQELGSRVKGLEFNIFHSRCIPKPEELWRFFIRKDMQDLVSMNSRGAAQDVWDFTFLRCGLKRFEETCRACSVGCSCTAFRRP